MPKIYDNIENNLVNGRRARRKVGMRNKVRKKSNKWLETLTGFNWIENATKSHVADKEGVSVFSEALESRENSDLVRGTNRIKINCFK